MIDLKNEIEQSASAVNEALGVPNEQDPVEIIMSTIGGLNDSIASMHIGIRVLSTRVATLEKYVAYLMQKDPEMGEKIKQHLANLDQAQDNETL